MPTFLVWACVVLVLAYFFIRFYPARRHYRSVSEVLPSGESLMPTFLVWDFFNGETRHDGRVIKAETADQAAIVYAGSDPIPLQVLSVALVHGGKERRFEVRISSSPRWVAREIEAR